MPLPFFVNLWACNPWVAEPERDAAQSQHALAPDLPPITDVVAPAPQAPPAEPEAEFTYSTEDWYRSLSETWPAKAAVITADQHVGGSMAQDVAAFVGKEGKLQCFDYAAYQMHVAGFRTTGRPSRDARNFQVLIEHRQPDGSLLDAVQLPETIEAVQYLKEVLHQDIPVLVGICLKYYSPRPNNVESTPFVEPTNHYVVIVGMDTADHGEPYFEYYDYRFRPGSPGGQRCRLYLKSTMRVESLDGGVVLAEVRRTMAR